VIIDKDCKGNKKNFQDFLELLELLDNIIDILGKSRECLLNCVNNTIA